MQLILDTGNIQEIQDLYTHLNIDGITTNPSIIAKEGKNINQLIEEINNIVDESTSLHVQVLSKTFDEAKSKSGRFIIRSNEK